MDVLGLSQRCKSCVDHCDPLSVFLRAVLAGIQQFLVLNQIRRSTVTRLEYSLFLCTIIKFDNVELHIWVITGTTTTAGDN